MKNYDDILKFIILNIEGGYTNDPDDRGGETKYGITKKVFERYKKKYKLSYEDIKDLTIEDAIKIYERFYLNNYYLNLIVDKKILLLYIDMIINHGIRRATKILQKSINTLKNKENIFNDIPNLIVDGILGKKTVSLLNKITNYTCYNRLLYYIIVYERIQYYKKICQRFKSQRKFLIGWIYRCYILMKQIEN